MKHLRINEISAKFADTHTNTIILMNHSHTLNYLIIHLSFVADTKLINTLQTHIGYETH
jgi:hypothetical protein